MKLSPPEEKAQYLKAFRGEIGVPLSQSMASDIWGSTISDRLLEDLPEEFPNTPVVKRKVTRAFKQTEGLHKVPFIKYVGISGSVGVGCAQEQDDIDLFIVVRDHTSWIVRIFVKLLLREEVVWYGEDDQQDKLCINYISEERGLNFSEHDIFTLNEIYSLKPLINKNYFPKILSSNPWLKEDFYAEYPVVDEENSAFHSLISIPFWVFNSLFFLLQLLYMVIRRHKPDYNRLIDGYKKGWIKFYPDQFRLEKLEKFEQSFSS